MVFEKAKSGAGRHIEANYGLAGTEVVDFLYIDTGGGGWCRDDGYGLVCVTDLTLRR